MSTFGETTNPAAAPPANMGQIVQRFNSRLKSMESALEAIGSVLGSPEESGNVGGSVFARLTYLRAN